MIKQILFFTFLAISACAFAHTSDQAQAELVKNEGEVVKVIQVNYVHVQVLYDDLVRDLGIQDGVITIEERTNKLTVRGQQPQIDRIEQYVVAADKPKPQVVIELYVIEAPVGKMKSILVQDVDTATSSDLNFSKNSLETLVTTVSAEELTSLITEMGTNSTSDQHTGWGKLVAAPRLMTDSGATALVEGGVSIPYCEEPCSDRASDDDRIFTIIQITPEILTDKKVKVFIQAKGNIAPLVKKKTRSLLNDQGQWVFNVRLPTVNIVLEPGKDALFISGLYAITERGYQLLEPIVNASTHQELSVFAYKYLLSKLKKNRAFVVEYGFFVSVKIVAQ